MPTTLFCFDFINKKKGDFLRIVFMGTPEFAAKSLQALIDEGNEILGVFTQPDKKQGRGQKVGFSAVKELALKYNLQVFQPNTLRSEEAFKVLKELNPELIVVVAYGKILPENILKIPPYGCVNVHGSLLPEYRGAAPIQWAVIDGKKKTGITTMYMDKGMDTGDMLLKEELEIVPDETAGELFDRLSNVGADLLIRTIEAIKNNEVTPQKQDETKATYAPMLNKDMAEIDWNKPAEQIHNLVRGLNPWPVAFTFLDGKKVKVYKTKVVETAAGQPGEIKSIAPFVIACGENSALEIVELQMENKKKMSAAEFFRGYKLKNNFLGQHDL